MTADQIADVQNAMVKIADAVDILEGVEDDAVSDASFTLWSVLSDLQELLPEDAL